MTTLKELKKCKSVKEIINLLDDDNFDRFAAAILLIWCTIPIIAIYGWVYKLNINIHTIIAKDFYRTMVDRIGVVTIVIYILYTVIRVKKKRISFKGRYKTQPWIFLMLGMYIWSFLACCFAENKKFAFGFFNSFPEGFVKYTYYAALLGFALSIRSDNIKIVILRVFSLIANIAMIIMVCQVWEAGWITKIFSINKSAMFFNSNHLGYYINMALLVNAGLFMFDRKKKAWSVVYIVTFAFQVYALILNDTFGCYVAAAVTIVFMTVLCIIRTKKKFIALIPLMIIILSSALSCMDVYKHKDGKTVKENVITLLEDMNIFKNHDSTSDDEYEFGHIGTGRMKLWIKSINAIRENPVFGKGPESEGGERPHNELLQHAHFIGIPGMLMYLVALILLLIRQLKNVKKITTATLIAFCAAVGYFISSMFGLTMFYTAPYYFMLLGFAFLPASVKTE